MITISIEEEVDGKQDMAYLLKHIAGLIEDGCTSGVYPHWELLGEEE